MSKRAREPSFSYRAWSICVMNDRKCFERHINRALREASKYRINRLELHDYVVPWVNFGIHYRDFPRLQEASGIYEKAAAGSASSPPLDFDNSKKWMKDLFRRIKSKGLKLNIWYHVGRDVPPGLSELYPEYQDVDTGFAYDFEQKCLTEFFELYPEVDGITVTSLHETDSILWRKGKASRRERLVKLYRSIHSACRKAGKDFILRGFIVKQKDYQDFNAVLDELPRDIIVMSKEVLADWCHIHQGKDPFLQHFARRRLVVEFDLYGEYQGRTALPYTDPEYYWHCLRDLAPLGIEGAVGRIVHDQDRKTEYPTIFDSFNEVNVAAFSNTLCDAGATIDSLGEWSHSMDTDVGMKLWAPWARKRFGGHAAPDAIAILRKCPDLVERTLSICGFHAQSHSGLMSLSDVWQGGYMRQRFDPIHPEGVLENWIRSEPMALSLIKSDKDDLVRSVRASLKQATRLSERHSSRGTADLARAMATFCIIAEASRTIALVYALGLIRPSMDPELRRERNKARRLARSIEAERGPQFHFCLSRILREWAGWPGPGNPQ